MLDIFTRRQAEAEAAKLETGKRLAVTYRGGLDNTDGATLYAEYEHLDGRAALYTRGGYLDECKTRAEAAKVLRREIADIKGYFAEFIGPFDERQPDEIKPFYAGYQAEAEAALDLLDVE